MKITKLTCLALSGFSLAYLTACEKHPASEVPVSHASHGAGHGHGHDSHDSHGHDGKPEAKKDAHADPTPAATPVPQFFPKSE